MASRGSVHGGKYGRIQAVVTVALDSFQEFDGWCLLKGFDPLEVPAYRFYHAALAWLMDDRMPDDIIKIENSLREADFLPHPLHAGLTTENEITAVTRARPRPTAAPRAAMDDLPLEEQKRREAEEQGKKFRVPDWWLGEEKAYKMGKSQAAGINSLGNFG